MSKMLNYKNKFMANSTLDLIPNDISWLKNSTKLIESKFIKYQSIQIYHPKNSSNFGESDQRLLDFKDFTSLKIKNVLMQYCFIPNVSEYYSL